MTADAMVTDVTRSSTALVLIIQLLILLQFLLIMEIIQVLVSK